MRLVTWNLNSIRARTDKLRGWLEAERPDVLLLQETKVEDAGFPHALFTDLGYQVVIHGQKSYNGVAIAALTTPTDVTIGFGAGDAALDEQARLIAATVDGVRVVCVYCPNGQAVGSDKYEYKLRWFTALRDYLAAERARHPELAVAGDFNVAPEDRDVHDPKAWEGQVHVSGPERSAWRALLETGLVDAFRSFEQPEKSFSWWDYRMMGFRRNAGLRIDHILLSPPLSARCTGVSIDKAPRRLERPSDHTPVIAEISNI